MGICLTWGSCYNADSDSVGLGWSPRFSVSKLSGDDDDDDDDDNDDDGDDPNPQFEK